MANYNMKDLAYFSGLLGSAQLDQNSIASSRELLNSFCFLLFECIVYV